MFKLYLRIARPDLQNIAVSDDNRLAANWIWLLLGERVKLLQHPSHSHPPNLNIFIKGGMYHTLAIHLYDYLVFHSIV
jgi:hypothetical protein